MSKAKEIFIDTMIATTGSKYPKEELDEIFSNEKDKDAVLISTGITQSMKAYALAFAQNFYKDISHVEIVMSDVEQFDKEII